MLASDVQPLTLTADEIVKYSGMNEWSRWRDTLRVVMTVAVDALAEEGILDRVEKDYDKQGKRIDDITFIRAPSKEFMAQLRCAKQLEAANALILQAITGSGSRPDTFMPVSPTQATETRQRRGASA